MIHKNETDLTVQFLESYNSLEKYAPIPKNKMSTLFKKQHSENYLDRDLREIMGHKDYQTLKNTSNHASTDLYDHSLQVSKLSMKICHKLGLDWRTVARAGLLHDFYLYDWRKDEGPRWHGIRHGRIALYESEKRFALSEKEKNIILRHMWPLTPIPPSSWEGIVLSMVDKYIALDEILTLEESELEIYNNNSGNRNKLSDIRNRNRYGINYNANKGKIILSRFLSLLTG